MLFEVGDIVVGKTGCKRYAITNEFCVMQVTKVMDNHEFIAMVVYHSKGSYQDIIGSELADEALPFEVKDFRTFEYEDYERLDISDDIQTLVKMAKLKKEVMDLQNQKVSMAADIRGMEKELTRLRSKVKKIKDALD